MAENVMQYLKENRCDGFKPVPHYSSVGDYLSYFVKGERAYAVRADELVTVYHSVVSNEMVGCKIKGVRRILRTLGDFGVSIDDGALSLSLFFMAVAVANPAQEKRYKELSRVMKDALVDTRDMAMAA